MSVDTAHVCGYMLKALHTINFRKKGRLWYIPQEVVIRPGNCSVYNEICLCLPGTGCPERVLRSDAMVSKLIFEKCYPNVNEMCLCGCLGQGIQKVLFRVIMQV